ncbi:immunoglobulin superfamily member 10 isoform X1 [Brachionus plicatilis]|uniref:Immunoglobulin superfamily member 10 isoform X1 n=1 Tax=Brachionus plicatilis TaxID=10195 RepID=A0A3M7Q709_BRAPC|nr:immunoglobulin superfamily member 10 isoform X1 [Brachionus plicatilis]
MVQREKQITFLYFILLIHCVVRAKSQSLLYINDDYLDNNYLQKIPVRDQAQTSYDHQQQSTFADLQLFIQTHRYSKSIEVSGFENLFSNASSKTSLVELFFPRSKFGQQSQIENLISNNQLDMKKFDLQFLNLSSNSLQDSFLADFALNSNQTFHSTLFDFILKKFFSKVKVLKLSFNSIQVLKRDHFKIFAGDSDMSSSLEGIMVDNNNLKSLKHDTFYDLKFLKFLDLSSNSLKIIHPLTFSYPYFTQSLFYLNLKDNQLSGVYSGMNGSLLNLAHFYLDKNSDVECDCGLEWIWKQRDQIELDFECPSDNLCDQGQEPVLVTNNQHLEETSDISLIRNASKAWFAWTVFVDHLPSIIPYPYLVSNETKQSRELINELENQEKHVYHTWLFEDVVLNCSNKNDTDDQAAQSAIIWKTQFGYFANFDQINQTNYKIFKAFYKLNKLSKIHRHKTVRISENLSAGSRSEIYIDSDNNLVVTNMRQMTAGSFVCLSVNQNGIKSYEYKLLVREGVSEYFIYSLFVSIISMIVPSILGIIICSICEYQADKNYPMTPPCFPTPMANTPPNFDFNEWMANAASYLPNLNIHETLEQVSKRLRKGMEKASVTVKSLGVTSGAYISSMYEQSSQRFYDLKQYVPNINVPSINLNLNLPTMRYPPMGQLANRMRTGMGNMFWQFREFCGSSDLTHTPSIVDIQSDCSASNAVGRAYFIDHLNVKDGSRINHSNLYRFLHLIKEESKLDKKLNTNLDDVTQYSIVSEATEEVKPSTSGYRESKLYPSLNAKTESTSNNTDDESECKSIKDENKIEEVRQSDQ